MFKHENKSVIADYETGYLYQIDYIGSDKLRWTVLKGGVDGAPTTGEETFAYRELSDDVFFINWIEEGGVCVSQVANFKTMEVVAFLTWEEEGARGNRGSLLQSGTLTFKE